MLKVSLLEGLDVVLKELLAVSEGETDSVKLEDSLLDMLKEGVAEVEKDDEELAEEDFEKEPLEELDSLMLWLPLSIEEGVDVPVDEALGELEDETESLSVTVELKDGESDELDDPEKVLEVLSVPEEVSVGLCVVVSEKEADKVSARELVVETVRVTVPDRLGLLLVADNVAEEVPVLLAEVLNVLDELGDSFGDSERVILMLPEALTVMVEVSLVEGVSLSTDV